MAVIINYNMLCSRKAIYCTSKREETGSAEFPKCVLWTKLEDGMMGLGVGGGRVVLGRRDSTAHKKCFQDPSSLFLKVEGMCGKALMVEKTAERGSKVGNIRGGQKTLRIFSC